MLKKINGTLMPIIIILVMTHRHIHKRTCFREQAEHFPFPPMPGKSLILSSAITPVVCMPVLMGWGIIFYQHNPNYVSNSSGRFGARGTSPFEGYDDEVHETARKGGHR